MFESKNLKWTTSPIIFNISNLYLAGSDAFLPAVNGAMYGGCFSAFNILNLCSKIKLSIKFITYFANILKEDNKTLSWSNAYYLAFMKIIGQVD